MILGSNPKKTMHLPPLDPSVASEIESLRKSRDLIMNAAGVAKRRPLRDYLAHNAVAYKINALLPNGDCRRVYSFNVEDESFYTQYWPVLDADVVSEDDLPPLTGSVKQIEWAEKIRRAVLEHKPYVLVLERKPNLLALLKVTSASYWINNHKGILYK